MFRETDGTGTIITSIDSDYDSVCDEQDLFPNDPLEWSDNDGDGVGDNSDYCPNDSGAWLDTDGDGVCDNNEIIGCTEEWADNYNENATDHDESCYRMGCVLEWADNFDSLATIDDSTCFRIGCTDSTMFNYDSLATEDNGSCIPFIEGCIDPMAFNYDSLVNTDNETCIFPLSFSYSSNLTFNFTNCEQEGRFGPDQSQVNNEYLGTSLEGDVISNDGIQEWVVPFTGNYMIEALGAAGNDGSQVAGYGAKMSGEFFLTKGELIQVLVGQSPSNNGYYQGAGGGGTFVTRGQHSTLADILIIAGGAGGTTGGYSVNADANISTNGGTSQTGCPGGDDGNGGEVCGFNNSLSCAGQGAGFFTDAGYTDCGNVWDVARAYLNGGAGGMGSCNNTPSGGFGGGGGTGCGGAGGGGLSGGGGSYSSGYAGGGGSYNSGENQDNIAGINEGHGHVTISFIGTLCSDPLAQCSFCSWIR